MTKALRQPAVAGTFYPENPTALQQMVDAFLAKARRFEPQPKALLVPHAGYVYSGAIAAQAYASLEHYQQGIKKIVLLGPAHTLYFKGIAYDPVDAFLTPLGEVPQSQDLLNQIKELPMVVSLAEAHEREHCLEVQLPFCQREFSDFEILPLVVGDCPEEAVVTLLDKIWGGQETLIIISSDLSHYLPYYQAVEMDNRTCLHIDTLEGDSLQHESACGYFPLRGFLAYARQRGLYARLLEKCNSGDTAGEKSRVVGYAAYHFYEDLRIGDHCRDSLIGLATETIRVQAAEARPYRISLENYSEILQIRAPSFITLQKQGELRGCMGSLQTHELLAENVSANAYRAAFEDPRFPKVRAEELSEISVSISILSPLAPLRFSSEAELLAMLRPGIDGLVLVYPGHQATFLPVVWESLPQKEAFLAHLKLKMGLAATFWSPEIRAYRYTAEYIS